MMKFNWSLLKSLEFINSRRPNLEIRASFLQQLSTWQQRRAKKGTPQASEAWDKIPMSMESSPTKKDEIILRNTFINAQLIMNSEEQSLAIQSISIDELEKKAKEKQKRIKWSLPENEPEIEQAPTKGAPKSKLDLNAQKKNQVLDRKTSSPVKVPPKVLSHHKPFHGKSILKKAPFSGDSDQKKCDEEDEDAILIN